MLYVVERAGIPLNNVNIKENYLFRKVNTRINFVRSIIVLNIIKIGRLKTEQSEKSFPIKKKLIKIRIFKEDYRYSK